MNIDFKITAWERVSIPDEHKDLILEKLKSKEIESSNELIEFCQSLNPEIDSTFEGTIPETDEQMLVSENGGEATIELLFYGETIFTNKEL